jgi:DNA-binding SARP family transcriptional activator
MPAPLLRIFGSPRLEMPDGGSQRNPGPKRLAVLVYLAVHGRSVSRDTLAALFWPEQTAAHARNSLNQVVHGLRAVLSPGAIETRGAALLVPPAQLACDARLMDAHLAAGELDAALALYVAPVLDGFHVPGAPDFERWVDELRAGYRGRAVAAAWTLADAAVARGDGLMATRFGRHAVDVGHPLDERRCGATCFFSIGWATAAWPSRSTRGSGHCSTQSTAPHPRRKRAR